MRFGDTAPQLTARYGPCARARQLVERLRDELLAGPALADDQHGRIGRRDSRHRGKQLLHRLRAPDQPAEARLRRTAAGLRHPRQDALQPLRVQRFRQVVDGTETHRIHRAFDRAVAGDQHDVALLGDRLLGQQLHPASVRQHKVHEDEIGHRVEMLARFGEARRERGGESVAGDEIRECGTGGRVVVDDQGMRHGVSLRRV